VYGKEYTPQQISAFILQKIKKDAETFLGYPIKKAVITVPATSMIIRDRQLKTLEK